MTTEHNYLKNIKKRYSLNIPFQGILLKEAIKTEEDYFNSSTNFFRISSNMAWGRKNWICGSSLVSLTGQPP